MQTADGYPWWRILLEAAAAFGTVGAVIVAIWGDHIRARVSRPLLRVTLRDPAGELALQADGRNARYYHLVVANSRRWPPARNVIVNLVGIELPAAQGGWQPLLKSGAFPLHWQFGVQPQTIGRAATCDVVCVRAGDSAISLVHGGLMPFYALRDLRTAHLMRLRVEASGDGCHSPVCVLDVHWDGEWADDEAAMAQHFRIQQVE